MTDNTEPKHETLLRLCLSFTAEDDRRLFSPADMQTVVRELKRLDTSTQAERLYEALRWLLHNGDIKRLRTFMPFDHLDLAHFLANNHLHEKYRAEKIPKGFIKQAKILLPGAASMLEDYFRYCRFGGPSFTDEDNFYEKMTNFLKELGSASPATKPSPPIPQPSSPKSDVSGDKPIEDPQAWAQLEPELAASIRAVAGTAKQHDVPLEQIFPALQPLSELPTYELVRPIGTLANDMANYSIRLPAIQHLLHEAYQRAPKLGKRKRT